jgi:uncharacterized protein (TIRG00374 family)
LLSDNAKFQKWVTVLAVLGFIAFIGYLFFYTDISKVGEVIATTNFTIYAAAFGCVIAGAVFNALAWKEILGNLQVKTTFRRVFGLSWVGFFVDSLIPGGWSGDVFITYLLSKDPDVEGAKAAAAIIVKDVLELLIVLGSLLLGISLLALNYSVSSVLLFAVGLTLIFLAVPLILIIYLSTNIKLASKLLGLLEKTAVKLRMKKANVSIEKKIAKQLEEFHSGVMIIKTNPKAIIKPAIYQSLTRVFEILTLFIIFAALGSWVGFDVVIITNTLVSNIQSQGIALAGFTQIVSSELYTGLGINISLAIASSLLASFSSFWFKLVISFAFFQVMVFERCVPFFCKKCGGWRTWRKSCPEGNLIRETATSEKNENV